MSSGHLSPYEDDGMFQNPDLFSEVIETIDDPDPTSDDSLATRTSRPKKSSKNKNDFSRFFLLLAQARSAPSRGWRTGFAA